MSCLTKSSTLALFAVLAFIAIDVLNAFQTKRTCEEANSLGKVSEIYVQGCEDPTVKCWWKIGVTKNIKITFTPQVEYTGGELQFKATVKLLGLIRKSYPSGRELDICEVLKCPLEAGKEQTLSFDWKALSIYPPSYSGWYFRLKTEPKPIKGHLFDHRDQIFCVHFPVRLHLRDRPERGGTDEDEDEYEEDQQSLLRTDPYGYTRLGSGPNGLEKSASM